VGGREIAITLAEAVATATTEHSAAEGARAPTGVHGAQYTEGCGPSMVSLRPRLCGHGRGSAILNRRLESTVLFHWKTEKIA
jgi:hypothetical protein